MRLYGNNKYIYSSTNWDTIMKNQEQIFEKKETYRMYIFLSVLNLVWKKVIWNLYHVYMIPLLTLHLVL